MKPTRRQRRHHRRPVFTPRPQPMHQNQRRPTAPVPRRCFKVMQLIPTRLDIVALHAAAPQMKSSLLVRHPKRIPVENQPSRNSRQHQKSHNAQCKLHSLIVSVAATSVACQTLRQTQYAPSRSDHHQTCPAPWHVQSPAAPPPSSSTAVAIPHVPYPARTLPSARYHTPSPPPSAAYA